MSESETSLSFPSISDEPMSSVASEYAEAKTKVFWDVEDCPIPDGLDPESVYQNIRTALARNGYRGEVSQIVAYGDKNQIPDYYESAGIQIKPEGNKFERSTTMLLDMSSSDIYNDHELSNWMVISRDGLAFEFPLESFKKRNHTILFANPEDAPRKYICCGTPSDNLSTQTWVWETLAAGGDPITKT